TPWIFPARTQAKLKQLTNEPVLHTCMGAAVCVFPRLHLLIACGMSPVGKYHDHIPCSVGSPFTSLGGTHVPFILPPATSKVAKTGVLDMPATGEKVMGGHAVVCVGYDDGAQRFTVRNSWSAQWGMNGYFTTPYTYLTSPGLASDFWMLKTVE